MKLSQRFALCMGLATAMCSDTAAGAIGAPPTAVVPLLPYQRAIVELDARFTWNNWSRQTGKSFAMSLRRILRGVERQRNQIFLSASEQQSRELMMKARQHCQAMKIATDLRKNYWADTSFRQLELTLPGGIRIIGLPANPRTARGFTGDVLLDEFAMHQNDSDIWASVFPTVLRGDGELDVASTPKGKSNKFYAISLNDSFAHSTVTLPEAIEQGLQADADEIYAAMGDEQLYRQEFLCEFLDESTAYLTYEMIAACEDPQATTQLDFDHLRDVDNKDGDLYVGVDIGRKRDLTVIWVLQEVAGVLATIGTVEMKGTTFRTQYKVLCDVLRLKGVRRCCIDSTGLGMQIAEAAVEDFGAYRVEAVTFTPNVKADLAGRLRIKVEDRAIRIPADATIRNDWHSIRRSVTSAGNVRYEGERTEAGHADRFWAAALAVHAAGTPSGPAEAMGANPLRWGKRRGLML